MVRQELSQNTSLAAYDLYRDGLSIYTTLDSRIQKYLNQAVEEHLNEMQLHFNRNWSWKNRGDLLKSLIKKAMRDLPEYRIADNDARIKIERVKFKDIKFIDSVKSAATTIQVGVVVINPTNGAILAMVGASPEFLKKSGSAKYSLNHAFQIRRQPGSAFKPFVYASALKSGLTPKSMIECGPFSITLETGEKWSPSGNGGCGPGEKVSLTDGIRMSINSVSARLVTSVIKPIDVVNMARQMGIKSPLSAVPAISLGAGGDVSPLELTSAYGTFLYNGLHVEPFSFSSVKDKNEVTVFQKPPAINLSEAISSEIAIQMTYMLEQVVNAGTASRAVRSIFKDIDAAGKTGTTNDAADAWFVGYTPQLVAGVWVGFDNKKITLDVLGAEGYGGKAAAPLWARLMYKIYSDDLLPYKQKKFPYKNNNDSLTIDYQIYPLNDAQKKRIESEPESEEEQLLPQIPIR